MLSNLVLLALLPVPTPNPAVLQKNTSSVFPVSQTLYDIFSPGEENNSSFPLCAKEGDKPKVGGQVTGCPRPHGCHRNQPPPGIHLELGNGAFWVYSRSDLGGHRKAKEGKNHLDRNFPRKAPSRGEETLVLLDLIAKPPASQSSLVPADGRSPERCH